MPWRSLQLQFGCSYKNPRHFKLRLLRYLKSVIAYYPAVRRVPIRTGPKSRGMAEEAVTALQMVGSSHACSPSAALKIFIDFSSGLTHPASVPPQEPATAAVEAIRGIGPDFVHYPGSLGHAGCPFMVGWSV